MRMPPPTVAATAQQLVPSRKYETFSKHHREQLALGVATGSKDRKSKSRARITVTVRKRPLTSQEVQKGDKDIICVTTRKVIRVEEPRKNVTGQHYVESHEFEFDRVYDEKCTNQEVYNSCVKNLVDAIFENGDRCSCFAFGQTGSGKTYTMVGPRKVRVQKEIPKDSKGLWEWAAIDLIAWVNKSQWQNFGLYCSFFEIYCNKVFDLLNGRKLVRALETRTLDGVVVVVKDLSVVRASTVTDIMKFVDQGLAERVVGKNSRNSDSSRGHAIFTVEVKHMEQQVSHGKLAFIDLAGSERGADSMQSNRTTQTDGAGINRSLLALKECIRAMDQGNSHVPFRDSELTKVLRDMFITDSALTLMIANVAPTDSCCEQTLNTMRYAQRVYQMRQNCSPLINEPEGEEEEVRSLNADHFVSQDEKSSDNTATGEYQEAKHSEPQDTYKKTEDYVASLSEPTSPSLTDDDVGRWAETDTPGHGHASRAAVSPISKLSTHIKPKGRAKLTSRLASSRPVPPYRSACMEDGTLSGDGSAEEYGVLRGPQSGRIPSSANTVHRNSMRTTAMTNSPRQTRPTSKSHSIIEPPTSESAPTSEFQASNRHSARPERWPECRLKSHSRPTLSEASAPIVATRKATTGTNTRPSRSHTRVKSKKISDSTRALYDGINSHSPYIRESLMPPFSRQGSGRQSNSPSDSGSGTLDESPAHSDDGNDTGSSSLYSPDSAMHKQDNKSRPSDNYRPETSHNPDLSQSRKQHRVVRRRSQNVGQSNISSSAANSLEIDSLGEDVKRAFVESIPPEILTKIRELLPPLPTDLQSLDTEDEDTLRKQLVANQSQLWQDLATLLDEQHATIKSDAALSLYHVRLAREFDNNIPTQVGSSDSSQGNSRVVELTPDRIKRIRDLIERKIYNLLSVGQALGSMETTMASCFKLERELQRRSLQSVQFYNSDHKCERRSRTSKSGSRGISTTTTATTAEQR